MIPTDKLIASHLNMEPNRAAIIRDLYRAEQVGLSHILVNENALAHVSQEIKQSRLSIKASAVIGFPTGQWFWPMKKTALEALDPLQEGAPKVLMHSVGSWLDQTLAAQEEHEGIKNVKGEKWLMTSLSAIPEPRIEGLVSDIVDMKIDALILCNGVRASNIAPPSPALISKFAKLVAGRFTIIARGNYLESFDQAKTDLEAGANAIASDHFWELSHSAKK